MPPIPVPVIVVVAAVVAAAIVCVKYADARRRKALSACAQLLGLRFERVGDPGTVELFGEFESLGDFSNPRAENVMAGDWHGRRLVGFDYFGKTHSADSNGRRSTRDRHFSAVVLESKVPLKPLLIRPEQVGDKIAGFIGFEDIDFESAEFSREFYVKAPEKRWAYDVLHPRAMEHLLRLPRFTIEFGRRHVIAYRWLPFKPGEFAAAAEVIAGLLDSLPEYVVRQQTGQG